MIFPKTDTPRIFSMPPGADFATALVNGMTKLADHLEPTELARIEVYVNTTRMQRRLREVFDAGPARILPRIRLVTDLAHDPIALDVPPPVSPLRRRLELTQFVAKLLDTQPDLAPRAALYDLSDSLAKLMDEMHGEGVTPETVTTLKVEDESGHWQRSLQFIDIMRPYFEIGAHAPDKEARQRLVITARIAAWELSPPKHPIIVAGSTGSRGATSLFMQAVSRLPQGAVVLPGYDTDMPTAAWDRLYENGRPVEDHPQYRFHTLLQDLDMSHADVEPWPDAPAPSTDRNALISLSLRPAPVTNQWLVDGPKLGNLIEATKHMTLVEATSPRAEADTIALRLRQAAGDGITAALITPDRMLTRQVAAALDRWDIVADDSAGIPLALSAPGRFLRHVADMAGRDVTAEGLLTLLKHPLCHSDGSDRGAHLRHTRELELKLRRYGPPYLTGADIIDWADRSSKHDETILGWAHWIGPLIDQLQIFKSAPLSEQLETHLAITEALAGGQASEGSGELWLKQAGREARRVCDTLTRDADAGGTLSPSDYNALFGAVLSQGVVRDRDLAHPNILIWGTLEARVQGADLVILGGMNDGFWPEAATPDPWLNRNMRLAAGLLLPERRIGLSAHDYQQAVAAKEVWITRAKRSSDAETVPSRWINRLTNLMDGLPDNNGPVALNEMRSRGAHWLAVAAKIAEPVGEVDKAKRPSPRPPIAARPTQLSVTRIKTLIRDPYAIYAENVLKLKSLDPLLVTADAPLRGVIYHKILERFISGAPDASELQALATLLEIAQEELEKDCPWPAVRLQWLTRFESFAPTFLEHEIARQSKGQVKAIEGWGEAKVPSADFTLTCKADRIDLTPDGQALIYDYKTGTLPTGPQQVNFDKQLLLESAMVERGAFATVGSHPVQGAYFLGIKADMKIAPAPLKDNPPDQVWENFTALLQKWRSVDRGYTARIALFSKTDFSPYDHLSRFGEWDTSDTIAPEVLT